VRVVDTTKNNYSILATVDITLYTSLKDLYEDLLAVKRDVFADDERIVIVYNSSNQKKLIDQLLIAIDIPDFFVIFEKTDNCDGLDFSFSDSFCIYPWINLRISTVGDISPCCTNTENISNLAQTTIQEAYHSESMKDLRHSFLAGKFPSSCSSCWKEEAVGKPSMRQRAKYKFKELYYKLDYQKENINNLQLFDLNLGNACNLSCKICNKNSSSSIAEQEYADGIISTVELQDLKQSVNWADSKEFWDQLLEVVQNIKYLDLYGGEPLMSKMHFKFLQRLIELDVAKNIKIDYNSNGTIYSERFFDLWQHFKEIKISFSIDDIGIRFEQQRVGAKWNSVCENIIKYNARRSEKFITEVFPTINIQNVLWLPELLDWIATQDFDHTAFNILHNPDSYNILSLKPQDKLAVIEKLKNYPQHEICNSVILMLDVAKNIDKSQAIRYNISHG
jgi:MoaA/NifB/PqqE/SkfB family radical SAM enzyme